MMNNNPIPELTTPNLRLRAFVPDDAEPLYRILCQDNILKYFPNPNAPTLERVERLVQHQIDHWQIHRCGWWAVIPRGYEELIGWNGLQYLPETEEVEVGYLLNRLFWGKGLATEGARAAIKFGFATLEVDEIVGLVHPDNIASQRVLEKSGLILTGRATYFEMELMRYIIKRPTVHEEHKVDRSE